MKKLFARVPSAPSSSPSAANNTSGSINGDSLSPRGASSDSKKPPMARSKSANPPPINQAAETMEAEPAQAQAQFPHHSIDEEDAKSYGMGGSLTVSQKRGFAGLCACLLPLVNDGSPEFGWSQAYLKIVVVGFLGLPESQVDALLPMLTAHHDALTEFALTTASPKRGVPRASLVLEKLDPAPFYALVMPVALGEGDDATASSKMKRFTDKTLAKFGKKSKKPDDESSSGGSDGLARSPSHSPRVAKDAVVAFQTEIVKKLLWFTVRSIGYDARTRTLLRLLVDTMRLSWPKITFEEVAIGRALYAEAMAMPADKSAAKPSMWDWKRNATIGAAAVTGGVLLAITGGLALPALAGSLTALGGAGAVIGTAMGSAAGVTATTVLFGTAGAGVVGMKTETRTRGVQQFSFDLVSAGDGMNVYICISGWLDEDDPPVHGFRRSWGDSRAYLRGFYRKYNAEKVDQVDQVLDRYKGREDEFFAILRKTYRVTGGSEKIDPLGMLTFSKDAATAATEGGDVSVEHMRAWRWKDRFSQGDQYCLAWEDELLRRFGKSMRTFARQQVLSYANNEIISLTAFAALFAAVAVPRTLLKAADIIDNVWVLVMNSADASGKILAETLQRREQGLRPVTLVGYGMGARVILSCLKKLAKSVNCFGIVENAVLLGAPVPVAVQEWKNARRVVAGRLINGYSENDWMLAVMYRYQGWALNPAGIGAIDVPGVENVNLSSIIKGHMDYKNKIGAIMDVIKLEG